MPQIFPKAANVMPLLSLAGALVGGIVAVFVVWYYFSPEFVDVGYAPEQPVPYSHRLHAGQLGIDCRYCHTNVDITAEANVPPTQTCMNCHGQVLTESLALIPVRESWATGHPVEWIKVNFLPDYVNFSHAIHVKSGVGCETCHGRVDRMEIVRQEEPLSMGWCLECHRQPELYLRPDDQIVTMGYVQPSDFVERNLERIEREGILPPTDCSACHY
jgi:hypothetical protein